MTTKAQFLQQFQDSLTRLGGVHTKIAASITQKKTFSEELIVKLRDINGKIQGLAGEITRLKSEVDGLHSQVQSNTASIGSKDKEVTDLQQRISALEAEKQQLDNQLRDLESRYASEKNAAQQQIDQHEASIRTLTEQNTAIKAQADALTAELAGKGDLQGQHAAEITKLTEESRQQLAAQQQANEDKINQLHGEVQSLQEVETHLNQQLAAKTAEVETHTQNISSTQTTTQSQITQLTTQIAALEAENKDFLDRIIAATQVIQQATGALEALEASIPPDAQTGTDITALFDEINRSIQNISGVIQGRAAAPPPSPGPGPSSGLPKVLKLPLTTPLAYLGKNFTLGELITDLNSKPKTNSRGQQTAYALTIQQINGATDADDVIYILQKNNITLTRAGKIFGGKRQNTTKKTRTKKNKTNKNKTNKNKTKKQKGGFTYRHIKRRSINSSRKHS